MTSGPPSLRPIEIASGVAFGGEEQRPRLPDGLAAGPLEALEHAIRPHLLAPPCLVSFSGGLDSSAVLAVACALARREGLALPVPATCRFPYAPSDEHGWQELVVQHVRPNEWLRLELTEELDAVGEIATAALVRHGLLWPCNAHFHVPLLEAARGGTLLTGVGGDELLGTSRWQRAADVLALRVRPRPRDVLTVALALAPTRARRPVLERRVTVRLPWLTPAGQAGLARLVAVKEAAEPRGYAARLAWWRGLRATRLGLRSLALLADDAGARIAHPLVDTAVARAMATSAPRTGPRDRGRTLRAVLGPLLPAPLYERADKARFDEAFWGERSRALAADWDGEGADPDLVDPRALRAEWSRAVPEPHTFTLLQSAWVASRTPTMASSSVLSVAGSASQSCGLRSS